MNRPAPRKSNLTGLSPITPPLAAEAPAPAPEVVTAPAAAVRAPAAPRAGKSSGGGAASTSGQKYPRLNYYVEDAAESGRIRAAFLAGRALHGWRTFSEMQRAGVLALVAQLENELNGGRPFEPTEPGVIPTGPGIQ
jgi:hypothetical protein